MTGAAGIARALADQAEDIAAALLGDPTSRTRRELRWGNRGSFSLAVAGDKRGQWYDHEAGEGGDMLHLIARERRVQLGEAIQIAEREFIGGAAPPPLPAPRRKPRPSDDEAHRIADAASMWSDTVPTFGALGRRYIGEQRGLTIDPDDFAHVLRWHPGEQMIVALMTDPVLALPCGVHRTWLDAGGRKINRKMRGKAGVIRLSPDQDVTMGLGIVEGIEDGLAVLASGWAPVWALASAGAIATFPVLSGIEALTIFADADQPGTDAADKCAARWLEAGREVTIVPPGSAP